MGRLLLLALAGGLFALAACGTGSKTIGGSSPQQPTDPRSVPTATLPSVLPSVIPAGTVISGGAAGSPTGNPSVYIVKPGDTMAAIAAQFGLTLAVLQAANPGVDPNSLKVGQELTIPAPTTTPTPRATAGATATAGRTATAGTGTASASATTPAGPRTATAGAATTPRSYTVQAGDTACKIATNFQISLRELAEANGLTAAGLASLQVGQQLKIPPSTGSPPGC
jgi:LysM repeat protein